MNMYPGLFQVWKYSVSHGLLLIRRNKDDRYDKRIDMLFTDVSYIELPVQMQNIQVTDLTNSEESSAKIPRKYQKYVANKRVYELSSEGGSAYVICSDFFIHEDELEYFEDSAFAESFMP